MENIKTKAGQFINCDKEDVFPCFITRNDWPKYYEAKDAKEDPKNAKMVLLDVYCKKLDMNLEFRLMKDFEVEIYDGIKGEWPEKD